MLVLTLTYLGLVSCLPPWSGEGLKGTGYPNHDNLFQHQHQDSEDLCNSLRNQMDVLIRSKIFQCERLPGDATGKMKSNF